jgi:hypothetical protein
MASNKRELLGFVRIDGSGRVVPTSLILRKNKPKVGRWVEVPAYLCCNPTTTLTTTSLVCATYEIVINEGETATWHAMGCDGNPITGLAVSGPYDETFCAYFGSPIVIDGSATITMLGIGCETTTTTTTVRATTTTSTTHITTTSTTTSVPTTTTTTTHA